MMAVAQDNADTEMLAYFEQLWPQFMGGLWFVTTSDDYGEILKSGTLRPALSAGIGRNSHQRYSDEWAGDAGHPVLFDFGLVDPSQIGLPALLALWRDCLPAEVSPFISVWLEIDRTKVAVSTKHLRQEISCRPFRTIHMNAVRRALFVGV